MLIRPVCLSDAAVLTDIYNYYIENTLYTLEETPLTAEAFSHRIGEITQKNYPYLVAEEQGTPVGYAYLSAFNPRSAYRKTADVSLYVAEHAREKGVGKALYTALEREGRKQGLENLISIITASNEKSLAFHQKRGFVSVGFLPRVGYKFHTYVDVCFYQKSLL